MTKNDLKEQLFLGEEMGSHCGILNTN